MIGSTGHATGQILALTLLNYSCPESSPNLRGPNRAPGQFPNRRTHVLTEWWQYLPAFLVVLAFLWLPGMALQWAFGQRTGRIILAAPAFSVAVVGLTGVLLDLVSIRYNSLTQTIAAVVLTVLAWLVGRLVPRGGYRAGSSAVGAFEDLEHHFLDRYRWLFPVGAALGLAIGAVLMVRRLILVIGHPDALAQRYDNIFHLNAIRYIVDTGNGSTLTLNQMTNPDSTIALYPAAWHQFASLMVPLTGDNVMVAHNIMLLATTGFVWTASCIYLARCILGPSPVVSVVAGTAAAGFGIFPLGLIAWGPLFANILSLSLVPVALGLLVRLLGPRLTIDPTARTPDTASRIRLAACMVVVLGGLCLSQPNALLALLAVAVPLGATAWWLALQAAAVARRGRKALILVVLGAVAVAAWSVLWSALSTDYVWDRFTSTARAVGEALLYSTNDRNEVPWILVILTATGIYAAISRRQLRWLVVAHLLLVYLYALAAAGENGPTRQWLVGGWYTDSYRLAATLPLTAVPLIAMGAHHMVKAIAAGLNGLLNLGKPLGPGASRTVVYPLVAVAVLATVVPLSQVDSLTQSTRWGKQAYTWESWDNILSFEEYELLENIDEYVKPDEGIAINPWNGGALAYAVADRHVTQYHVGDPDPLLQPLVQNIDDAAPGSPACAAAEELDVEWVLDFGTQFLPGGGDAAHLYDGVTAVDRATDQNLQLVEHNGSAKLYEIVGCD